MPPAHGTWSMPCLSVLLQVGTAPKGELVSALGICPLGVCNLHHHEMAGTTRGMCPAAGFWKACPPCRELRQAHQGSLQEETFLSPGVRVGFSPRSRQGWAFWGGRGQQLSKGPHDMTVCLRPSKHFTTEVARCPVETSWRYQTSWRYRVGSR